VWTVPIGVDIGRVFRIGDQAFNAQVAGYCNVMLPDGTADWQLRLQLALGHHGSRRTLQRAEIAAGGIV